MAEKYLKTPFKKGDISNLKLGDTLNITGVIFLMRDEAHERALKWHKEGKKLPFDIKDLAVFHCGPIVQKKQNEWKVLSAGPTTSMRMELFEDDLIKNYGVKVVIGKGGMGIRTISAMKKYGAVYASYPGGAGVLLMKKCFKKVKQVHWLDLGSPEAFWVFEVENFGPLTISIDAHGNSLYNKVSKEVDKGRAKAYKYLGIKK